MPKDKTAMKIKINIKVILIILFLALVVLVIGFKYFRKAPSIPLPTPENIATFTLDELKKFNGQDPSLPIYMVYGGLVYDVSSGQKFYGKDTAYNYLTGRDVTEEIDSVGLGDTIKRKYPVVGKISSN